MISLASGAILGVGANLLTAVVLPGIAGTIPAWLVIVATPLAAALGFLLAQRRTRHADQTFIVISAFTHTRWLADLLDNLAQSLDRHGIDLVVKLPAYDHSGRSQLLQLDSLLKRRRSYIGGFIIPTHPERIPRELTAFCQAVGQPVVFIDVRPFHDPHDYPDRTAFVGCDSEEIGQTAAEWLATRLAEEGVQEPSVLIVGGNSQPGRHVRFEARLRELLPTARIQKNLSGFYARERAREVVDHYLRAMHRRNEHLHAIFCANDEMALGVADAVLEHAAGKPAGDHPIIIGVDGIAEAIATIKFGTTPFQATVVQDHRRVAEVAVDALLRMRAGERVTTEILMPVTVYPMH